MVGTNGCLIGLEVLTKSYMVVGFRPGANFYHTFFSQFHQYMCMYLERYLFAVNKK